MLNENDIGQPFFSSRINLLKKPLQRIAIGGTLAGAAFVISGFLELATMVSALHLFKCEAVFPYFYLHIISD